MNVEHIEDTVFQVEFEFCVYTKERPDVIENPGRWFRIEPLGTYCTFDDMYEEAPPGVLMSEYAWDVLRAPDICAECEEEGLGAIGIAMSDAPFAPAVRMRDRRLPPAIRQEISPAGYLPLDATMYERLKDTRHLSTIDKSFRRLVRHARGDDLFATHLNAFYLYDTSQIEQHMPQQHLERLTGSLVRLAQFLTRTYDGIASDDYRWHSGAFDTDLALQKLHEDASYELVQANRNVRPQGRVVSFR